MSLYGIKKDSKKMGIKNSPGPWHPIKENSKFKDGIGLCGHYDVELDCFGYCRDEDCKRERFIKALYDGEAIKTENGMIIWTPGFKIRDVKSNHK